MSLVSKPRTLRKSCFTCRPSGEQSPGSVSASREANLPCYKGISRASPPACLSPATEMLFLFSSIVHSLLQGAQGAAGRAWQGAAPDPAQSELWFLSSSALLGLQAQQPGLCLHCCWMQLPLPGLWWLPWLLPLAQTWGNPAPCGFFSF